MNISELVEKLNKIQSEEGDLEVNAAGAGEYKITHADVAERGPVQIWSKIETYEKLPRRVILELKLA